MKKLFILGSSLLAYSVIAFSQTKKAIETVKIKVPTVQCAECKTRIENYLLQTEGISKATVDVKKKICTVTFSTERTNIEIIKTSIANAGYDADDVTANEDSYKLLPKCCKKPEDGGGHPKK